MRNLGLGAAIHLNELAVDKGALVGRKQVYSRRDLLGQAKTPERYFRFLRLDVGRHLGIIRMLSGNGARRDDIGRDAFRAELLGKRLGEPQTACLATETWERPLYP